MQQRREPRPDLDLGPAREMLNSATVTVGGLYLATHSVTVTLIGAAAACVMAGWALLAPGRGRDICRGRD